MPTRPLHPCARCPKLTATKYCAVCEANAQAADRARDRARGTSSERLYDAWWRRERLVFLAAHPLCECEVHKGKDDAPAANTVDHIKPHNGDLELFRDKTNWQALTATCHSRKTAKSDGRWGRRVKVSA